MRKCWKVLIIFLEAVLLLPVFSGCWSYHELETYSIVSGLAVDKGQNGYKYHLTIECAKVSGAGNEGEMEPLIFESDGNTIFEAIRSLLRESDKKLYFNHCNIVIVSSDIAREGLRSIEDWFKRDAEPRITTQLLISREKTAGEILQSGPKSGQILSYQIANTLNQSAKNYGGAYPSMIYEITNILNTNGISLVLPAIETKKEPSGDTVQLSGGAVFQDDYLVGWLDPQPAQTYALIRDKVKGGLILTGPTPDSTEICLEILNNKTKMNVSVSGNTVTPEINVNMRAGFAEQNSETDYLSKAGIAGIEKYAEQTIEYRIEELVKSVQQRYGSDIFGFGNNIYQNQPGEWDELKPKWNQIFKTLNVKVNATVHITNTALNKVIIE
jgi:spore germination protein KC